MIKSFSNKKLENLFYDGKSKGINQDHLKKLNMILDMLDQSVDVEKDMNYPGSKLHKLEPKKDNRWAVSVSGNWRMTFIFKEGNVYEVDYCDYH
jgi:proteic killer suppression protein